MKVKLRCRIPGHLLNDVVDLPDPQARLLVSQRQAVPVHEAAEATGDADTDDQDVQDADVTDDSDEA